ncbi:phage tail protein [Ralstonia pseudosolanacearum]|uniref:phage tail protein n=1 Tax=Ralstonia pseudosolanacearum TaxID=1310165 RepID=UPI001910232C|nr:tail fiber protein [Ralstonia solanacearum]
MMKATSLREALTVAVPHLAAHPDALHVFVDEGRVVGTGARSLGFEYQYTLTLIVTDYPHSSDTIVVPTLAWMRTNQPDAFTDPDKRLDAFKFEAEILNHETVDISIKLQLTERVTVAVAGHGYQVKHHPEPINEEDNPATWRPA